MEAVVRLSLDGPGELEIREPPQRLLEPDLELQPSQLVAEAEVAPDPERQVLGALARDVERVWIRILGRIAVGGGVPEDDLLVLGDRHAADLEITGRRPRLMHYRCV